MSKIDVNISNKSKEYLGVLDNYELKDSLSWNTRFSGTVIFHLYPTEDTMNDDNDDLQGFIDAMMFDVHIYVSDDKAKYIIKGRDQIEINVPARRVRIRIFKDLSTMIIVEKGCSLSVFQSMEINP